MVRVGRWRGTIEEAASHMDDGLRERLHGELAPCDPQTFVDAYAAAHLEAFGEEWKIATPPAALPIGRRAYVKAMRSRWRQK